MEELEGRSGLECWALSYDRLRKRLVAVDEDLVYIVNFDLNESLDSHTASLSPRAILMTGPYFFIHSVIIWTWPSFIYCD